MRCRRVFIEVVNIHMRWDSVLVSVPSPSGEIRPADPSMHTPDAAPLVVSLIPLLMHISTNLLSRKTIIL